MQRRVQVGHSSSTLRALPQQRPAAVPAAPRLLGGGPHPLSSQEVKNYSPGNMEQAPCRGHEASPQSGLGVG